MTTTTPAGAARHYDRNTIRYHWLSALLVVLLWVSAQFIDYFPKGPSRWNMLGVHMSMGVALAVILACRLRWKRGGRAAAGFGPLPESNAAARAGHLLMYVTLAAVVFLGFANAWVRGEHIFNFMQLPEFDPGNKPLRKAAGLVHAWGAHALLILAGLHALVALVHQYVLRDRLLERMLPAPGRR
jgi:cytochrome b561